MKKIFLAMFLLSMTRKENQRKILIVCLQLLLFTVVYAKDPTEVKSNDGIIPRVGASPEVAMLGKFDYAPVNNYNGVPDISIPLYTIQENGIELPIVLRYNSSGIKVSEEATWVGLGWDLTVGGAITQIPVGQPDQNDNLSLGGNPNGYGYVNRMIAATKKVSGVYNIRNEDGELFSACVYPSLDSYSGFWLVNKYKYGAPDNYMYSIPGTSGKFFIDQVNNTINFLGNRTEQVIIKGLNLTSNSVPYSSNWTITDLNGVQYNFNNADKEITDTYPQPVINNSGTDNAFTSATWRISNIVYPANSINFTYTNAKVTINSYSEYYFRPENGGLFPTLYPDSKKTDQRDECSVKYLNKVESNNQRIEFELSTLSTDRQDLSGAKRLNRITIFDKLNNRKIKSYKFNYDYFNSTNSNALDFKRLKLTSIDEIGYNGTVEEKIGTYKFEYDETKPLPSKRSYAMDYWGYYNGRSANTGLLPKLYAEVVLNTLPEASTLPPEVINDFLTKGNANRGVDTLYMKAGILTKITYPTGGTLKLQYQANSFTNYTVLTAQDNDLTISAIHKINLTDIHYNSTSSSSDKLSPDKNGKLTLFDFLFTVTRLSNTASKLTGANFKNAKVDLLWGYYYPTGVAKTWEIPTSDFQNFSNQIAQTGSGTYTLSMKQFEYQGDPTYRYWLQVSLGGQMPTTICSYPCEAVASLTCTARDPISTPVVSYGGGLRIVSQEVYDTNNQLSLKKIYSYTNDDGTSSGKLMSPLKFFSFQKIIYKNVSNINGTQGFIFTISSNSNIPLAFDASGALVGYNRVAVTEVDATSKTNGQTVSYYYNTPTQFTGGLSEVPNIPRYNNGFEYKTQYYDSQKNLVKESNLNYTSIQNSESTGVFIYDNYVGPDQCDPLNGVIYNRYAYHGRWYVCTYPLIGTFYKPTKRTDTDYFQGQPVVNEYVYEYNQYGQTTLESHRQLANSGKEDKQYKYPLDATDATSNSLRLKGLYNSIINEKTTRNNTVADEKNYEYTTTASGNMKVSAVREMINNDPYYQLSSVLYDAKDNVRQFLKNTDPMTVLLWGYNYQYPIAEIKGLSYADVSTALGQSLIDRIAVGTPSDADMTSIRTTLASKNALVTTFSYFPLKGMISSTTPNGITTCYSYDSWSRLNEIYFMDGVTKKVIQSYIYHYQNQ